MKIVAITSCPNGIAHTYMAAENLEKAAKKLGVSIKVETQGGVGVENALTEQEILEADGVIIAADRTVDLSRFTGKRLINTNVQEGIRQAEILITRFEKENISIYRGHGLPKKENADSKQNPIYRHLMNGVSFMVPFIVVGGLLIALALTIGGTPTETGIQIPDDSIWKTIEQIGAAAFSFMVPILSGYIAYSIADKPGLAPGVIGGYIAANGSFYNSEASAGFLGGIIAGFLAGYIALGIKKLRVPKMMMPIMPIIIIPLFASLAVSLIFVLVIGAPVAQVFVSLTSWLEGMQGYSSVLLALILGAMISFDMGGPVNKVAFLFGSSMIVEGNYEIMGAIAAAIAVPPIGMGLSTLLSKKKFTNEQRETGKASLTMGFFGITEGAIPFAAQDPLRVIPSIMIGSMVASVIAMLSGVLNRVAHGGPIVGVLGAISNVFMFFVSIGVGALVVALMIELLKKDVIEPRGASGEKEALLDKKKQIKSDNDGRLRLIDLSSKSLVHIEVGGKSRDQVIDTMIDRLVRDGAVKDFTAFKEAVISRENESTTGIGMGVAIPHGKSEQVKQTRVALYISQEGVDWASLDGTKAHLIFMIAVPVTEAGESHLKILQLLSRKLMDDAFRARFMQVTTQEEAYQMLAKIA